MILYDMILKDGILGAIVSEQTIYEVLLKDKCTLFKKPHSPLAHVQIRTNQKRTYQARKTSTQSMRMLTAR